MFIPNKLYGKNISHLANLYIFMKKSIHSAYEKLVVSETTLNNLIWYKVNLIACGKWGLWSRITLFGKDENKPSLKKGYSIGYNFPHTIHDNLVVLENKVFHIACNRSNPIGNKVTYLDYDKLDKHMFTQVNIFVLLIGFIWW